MAKHQQSIVKRILLFTLLVNGLAWLGPLLGGSPSAPGPGFLLWGLAPILSALVLRYGLRDQVNMGWKPNVRGNIRYYLLSLLIHPLVIGVVTALGMALGLISLNAGFSVGALVTAMLPLSIIYFVFAIFEEVGWRGYLVPSVARVNDRLLGHAAVGVIWASWHLPYMRELWAHTDEALITFLPRFFLGAFVFSVLYGEIRLRTNSVWPAVLMHWSGNTVANTLLTGATSIGFVTLAPESVWLTSFGIEGGLVIGLMACLGGALYYGRVRGASAVPAKRNRPGIDLSPSDL